MPAMSSTPSIWEEVEVAPGLSPLSGDLHADVCVVGAGIAGISTAYQLGQEGLSVVVLDAGPVGGGETAFTTAHLACAVDDRFCHIQSVRGETCGQLAADSHAAAIDRIEATIGREHIQCDFERLDGYLFEPPGATGDLLGRELAAARRAGLTSVELLPRAPLPSFDTGSCLRFPRQGQFHPLKYLAGRTRAIQKQGGRIFTHTRVQAIHGGERAEVRTSLGRAVTARAVVVATNTPVNNLVAVHTAQAPYLTYVIAAPVPRGHVPRALYWDTLDPYHYVRLQHGPRATPSKWADTHDLLIVGGEDHKTGQADDQAARFDRLEAWARERFPSMEEVVYRWSGQVLETPDGLALIGRNPTDAANVFIVTGDSGMGMTHGTIASVLLTDLIQGRPNPWADLYDPARIPLAGAWEYAKENLNVAVQYGGWLTSGDLSSADQVAPGSGAVIRRGLAKIAVYRDDQGRLHERSAVCPHLGCIVRWNDAEKTWDCPCHGSRFSKEGEVRHGPAVAGLSPVA